MSKITPEELERLNEYSKILREARNLIADIEIQSARLKIKKESAIFNAEQALNDLRKTQEEIHNTYGNVLIDLETGEIKADNDNT
jgi:hypothetical protein